MKSPRTNQATEMVAATADKSAANSAVREWSEGAYTFVMAKERGEVVEARTTVREKTEEDEETRSNRAGSQAVRILPRRPSAFLATKGERREGRKEQAF